MKTYDHRRIERKWQREWAQRKLYQTSDSLRKKKFYILDMFPYPSGEGLHVGHPRGYIATDVISRYRRMCGYDVLHPMGFDAFGLPAENFAIEHKVHPESAVKKNIARYKRQFEIIGFDYDWSREINTTDPNYYRWTQWMFLQMFNAGLVYRSNESVNWCPRCKTALANEDLEDGRCERCGSVVTRRLIPQWMIRITNYADRLLADLDTLDWPEHVKEQQRNWIGRSEGAVITFRVTAHAAPVTDSLHVFTTRPDTLFGATYLVLAPEHPLIAAVTPHLSNRRAVERYVETAQQTSEIERGAAQREKTGEKMGGIVAVNPANQEEIPIFVADYVLAAYGTGAIMAVPAHDVRDYSFAKKYHLPIREVISGGDISKEAYVGEGTLVNSGTFSGVDSAAARKKITEWVHGTSTTRYKLRDWVFSRQRYWGEPIPLIFCKTCGESKRRVLGPKGKADGSRGAITGEDINPGWIPVPEKDLPVKLPDVSSYEPTGTGESPLAAIAEWVHTTCPRCGGPAKRETNTMPQWAGSSWYYLRYLDPKNKKRFAPAKKEKRWMPVDLYVGGAEHATRHLIYARFWHKFLYDAGHLSTSEPFRRYQNQGLILAADGRKMSKRYRNVINPDDIVAEAGADTLRVYEMFMGPFSQSISWSTDNMVGVRRFLEKVWKLKSKVKRRRENVTGEEEKKMEAYMHRTIKKVTADIEGFRFNTAVSALMIFANELARAAVDQSHYEALLILLAPFSPHVTEEIWASLGHRRSIHLEPWVRFDPKKIVVGEVRIAVQVNGKTRATFGVPRGTSEELVRREALALSAIKKWIAGKKAVRTVYVPDRLVNLVVTDS